MEFHKLTSTDAFIVFDLGDAPSVGVVRQAPKVLKDGAELLARSTTYAMAAFGLQLGGASAGINAKPDDRDAALAAFTRGGGSPRGERPLAPRSRRGDRGRRPRRPGPGRGAGRWPSIRRRRARARWPRPSARSASLDGKHVAIVGNGPITEAAASSASANGATPQPQASFDTACDALLVAGKAGVLEHDLAATVQAKVVVPLTPVPVTARALAVLGRAGVVVVPDFLSTAAPALTAVDPDGERRHAPGARRRRGAGGRGHATSGWPPSRRPRSTSSPGRTQLPFGRPLA